MERAVVLASGGLDSTVLLHWAISHDFDVTPVFINYGQHCAGTEWETLRMVAPAILRERIVSINIADVFRRSPSRLVKQADLWTEHIDGEDLMLPYRNLFLLTAGTAFAASVSCGVVLSAFINSNHAQEIDATAAFLAGVGQLIATTGPVRLEMPFRNFSKRQVAELGLSLLAPIAQTFSCQANAMQHCGACPNCVERLQALAGLAA
jgi:7-cyano-7-deazaguanine synthase